jgi:hypothetical protein
MTASGPVLLVSCLALTAVGGSATRRKVWSVGKVGMELLIGSEDTHKDRVAAALRRMNAE